MTDQPDSLPRGNDSRLDHAKGVGAMSVGDLPEMHAAAGLFARTRLIGSIGWAVIFATFVTW